MVELIEGYAVVNSHSPSRNSKVVRGALIPKRRDSRYDCKVLDQVTNRTSTSPMMTAIRVNKDTGKHGKYCMHHGDSKLTDI